MLPAIGIIAEIYSICNKVFSVPLAVSFAYQQEKHDSKYLLQCITHCMMQLCPIARITGSTDNDFYIYNN